MLFHFFCSYTQPIVLPGCMSAYACKCGKRAKPFVQHSFGNWGKVSETWYKYRMGVRIDNSQFVRDVQVRHCVRCNWEERSYIDKELQ